MVLGTGPYPIISGSTPANANEIIFAFIERFNSFALLSDAKMAAVAPSFNPAALPAVTRPAGLNGVLRAAKASKVVCGRGGSSTVAIPQPRSTLLVATGIKSG